MNIRRWIRRKASDVWQRILRHAGSHWALHQELRREFATKPTEQEKARQQDAMTALVFVLEALERYEPRVRERAARHLEAVLRARGTDWIRELPPAAERDVYR